MTAEEMWRKYCQENNINHQDYQVWSFGVEADQLAELVKSGHKTATSSLYQLYALEKEALPQVGDFSVILDGNNQAACIIQNTQVYQRAYGKIDVGHAYKEGEDDRSLKAWYQAHDEIFTQWLREVGLELTDSTPIWCEEFRCVYPLQP